MSIRLCSILYWLNLKAVPLAKVGKMGLKINNKLVAVSSLVLVTAVWGLTFVMVKGAISRMPVMDFLAIRFALATLIMIVIRPLSLTKLSAGDWKRGAILGALLGAGYAAQTFGLTRTSAAVSGFITGMFVVFTPLIAGLILRRPIGRRAWTGVGVATAGLAVISLRGFSIGTGELLTLACALIYAVHIVGLGEWSGGRNPYSLAVVQLGVVTIICVIAALPGGITLPNDQASWVAVLEIGRASCRERVFVYGCRSRWSPYHSSRRRHTRLPQR